jgi:hypothetical protein
VSSARSWLAATLVVAVAAPAVGAGAAARTRSQSPGAAGPKLFVAGRLADFEHRPLRAAQAEATILATGSGPGSGIARIAVSVDGKRAALDRVGCRPRCPRAATFGFTYKARRFGPGRHRVRIVAADAQGRKARRVIVIGTAAGGGVRGAPEPDPAYYLTAASAADLRLQAYDDGARFASGQGGGHGLLLLDFDAARRHGQLWGARLRGGTFFSNRQIGSALEAAAAGYHRRHRRGRVTIVYANSNANMGDPGHGDHPFGVRAAREAGRRQGRTVRRLHLFGDESAAVAGDIEPGFDVVAPPRASVAMVSGAVAAAGKPYFDIGTAPCHGRDCTNGWTPKEICAIVRGGGRYAIPEVYFGPPLNQADEWATIQAECGITAFAGVSASSIGTYTPQESWALLNAKANAPIDRTLLVFPG